MRLWDFTHILGQRKCAAGFCDLLAFYSIGAEIAIEIILVILSLNAMSLGGLGG